MTSIRIAPAAATDLPAVQALLRRNGLPIAGLAACADTLLVARDGTSVVGCAALERYGGSVLVRSVAVDSTRQGGGIGTALVHAVLGLARNVGARRAFLLTETADDFFAGFGFRRTTREAVPDAVQASDEFQFACPASARVMSADLTDGIESAS